MGVAWGICGRFKPIPKAPQQGPSLRASSPRPAGGCKGVETAGCS